MCSCLCSCNHMCMRALPLMVKWIFYSLKTTSAYVMKNVLKDTFQAEAARGQGPVNSYVSFAIHSSNP